MRVQRSFVVLLLVLTPSLIAFKKVRLDDQHKSVKPQSAFEQLFGAVIGSTSLQKHGGGALKL